MSQTKTINARRKRRGFRIRNRIKRDSTRPRLTVFRSNSNMYAQIIDDEAGKTLVSASTMEKGNRGAYGGNKDAAKAIGKLIAERALAAGIKEVAFDRGDSKYHGRIAALAEGAREGGLQF
ncbi:MAG: 50S ribosomal protein L18 [Planctomycetales bacterium]|nr:50S ribosomal protein L18 [Planctomycetales bacterium]MBN8625832.1 50S ribosomal protein L18 [Planctomycetota bacterium]